MSGAFWQGHFRVGHDVKMNTLQTDGTDLKQGLTLKAVLTGVIGVIIICAVEPTIVSMREARIW